MASWILVIEDDPGVRDALVDILRRAGYQVLAWAGDHSLEAFCSGHYIQVAVVDYHLPFQNGLEVARQLKQFQPDCRVILISSDFPEHRHASALAKGVDRFLAKPFSKDSFLEIVGQLCPAEAP